jgi:PilZ domain-containing protein
MPAKRATSTLKPPAPAKQSPKEASGASGRVFHRYPFRGRANAVFLPLTPQGVAEEWEVVTTDVSRGGISIMHRKELAIGQQVMLVLNDDKRLVEVCWCCQVWPGLYAAGCRFINEPAGAAVHALATDER